MAQIIWDLQYEGQAILFSWPSRGGVLNYQYDRESALFARDDFLSLLKRLREAAPSLKINVLAHSMGNLVVMEALREADKTPNSAQIAELIFAAPDVDRDQFVRAVDRLRPIVEGMTLYASSADRALSASKTLSKIPRAGDVPAGGPVIAAGLESIDATSVGDDIFGLNHDKFATSRAVLDDLHVLLSDQKHRPPHERLGQIRRVPEMTLPPIYWKFAK